jgi:formylglycine-generating enzyme required for sulfatase activity
MSPEQCCGGTVDWASDVYSLGVMACEMLSGRLPHAAQGPAVMQAHVDDEPRPQALEGVPEPIAALVFRMLAKQSWHRPTAAVVASELQMPKNGTMPFVFAPTVEGSVREAIVKKPSGGSRRRRGWRAAAALLGLAALGAGGLVAAGKLRHEPKAAAVALAGMVRLPGGPFVMGLTPAQVDDELKSECAPGSGCKIAAFYERAKPARNVTLSPFFLDVHEVTNSDVVDWLNLSPSMWAVVREEDRPRFIIDRRTNRMLLDLYATWSGIEVVSASQVRARPGTENRPVVQISWDGALAYCEQHGKRLPTEAEWEFAARGVAKRTYPWGEAAPSCDTVTYGRHPGGPCEGRPTQPDDVGAPTRDVTPEGVRSLGGNVSEWVADALTPFYGDCGRCVDPRADAPGPPEGTYRIFRGAAYDTELTLKTTRRGRWNQATPANTIGFRCAVDGK